MKLGILFSGGKDSVFASYLAKQEGNELTCLISIFSKNTESFMFHTPSIKEVEKQAKVMDLPILIKGTEGERERELEDLEEVIKKAKSKFKIEGIVTGAVASTYQAYRIKKICDKLKLECINPLWQKDQIEILNDLIKNKFKVIIVGVAAYPLDESWLGREINKDFIKDAKKMQEKYKIHPAGEGGEFESFVLNCPLFKRELKIIDKKIKGENNSFNMEITTK